MSLYDYVTPIQPILNHIDSPIFRDYDDDADAGGVKNVSVLFTICYPIDQFNI